VNKNTLLAFVLILGTVIFFYSPFYYEQVLKKPYPFGKKSQPVPSETVKENAEPSDSGVAGADKDEGKAREEMSAADGSAVDSSEVNSEDEGGGTAVEDAAAEIGRAQGDTVWVETEDMIVGIAERGGAIVSVRMKNYGYRVPGERERVDSLIQLVPRSCDIGGGTIAIDNESYADAMFKREGGEGRVVVDTGDTATVSMVGSTAAGKRIEKEYSFEGDSYLIGLSVRSTAIAGKNLKVNWSCGIDESEWKSGDKSVRYDQRRVHVYDGSSVEAIQAKKGVSEERTGTYRWVGVGSKYFVVTLIAEEGGDADVRIEGYRDSVSLADEKSKNLNYRISMTRLVDDTEELYRIYAGPKRIGDLRAVDVKLEKVLYGGWWWFLRADVWFPILCEWMVSLLIGLHSFVKDYGVAILLITVVVKAITYPLSVSSMKSMGRMKEVQPKINALRQRYKSDPRKMNEELMELYRKEGINPFNPGCLPMFLQMPILISLFVVLRKAIELRGSSTVLIPWIKDLSQAEVLFRLPLSLPMYGDNFALLPVIMAGLTFAQNKMTMKDPNQAAMVYVMPLVMLVLFNNFPAGLVMYWTFSSALQLVQQRFLERKRNAATPVASGETGGGRGKKTQRVSGVASVKGARKKKG